MSDKINITIVDFKNYMTLDIFEKFCIKLILLFNKKIKMFGQRNIKRQLKNTYVFTKYKH